MSKRRALLYTCVFIFAMLIFAGYCGRVGASYQRQPRRVQDTASDCSVPVTFKPSHYIRGGNHVFSCDIYVGKTLTLQRQIEVTKDRRVLADRYLYYKNDEHGKPQVYGTVHLLRDVDGKYFYTAVAEDGGVANREVAGDTQKFAAEYLNRAEQLVRKRVRYLIAKKHWGNSIDQKLFDPKEYWAKTGWYQEYSC